MAHMTHIEAGYQVDGLFVIRMLHMRRGSDVYDMKSFEKMKSVAERYGIQIRYRGVHSEPFGYVIGDKVKLNRILKSLGYTTGHNHGVLLRCSDSHLVADEFEKIMKKISK
jgi:hypothetical protein